jgi:nicotinamide-nucleotide amidase
MIVETVAIGTELLLGQIVNTNATRIGERLADAGFDHYHQVVVGDNLDRMVNAIRQAADRADAVIITGGIGPTQDDVTRDALCAVANVEMLHDAEYEADLRRRWEARGRVMPESNLRQAQYPAGAEMIPNPKGSAPGLRLMVDGTHVFAVPGVPAEMLPMIDDAVIPFLREASGEPSSVVVSRLIRSWGLSESKVGEMLGDLFDENDNPTVAFLASSGEIKVRLTAKAPDTAAAAALIAPLEAEVRDRLGPHVFGADGDTIERVLLEKLEARGWSIATAESATGGQIAGRLTSVPGASAAYRGSVVAYHEDLKRSLLEVPAEVIEQEGVVSEATACAMAEGAAKVLGSDVAIAVTGSAGPDPQERPAGTMVVAVRTPEATRARTMVLPGDRERVRTFTTTAALHLARLAIDGTWWWSDDQSLWGVRPGTDR